MEKHKKRKRKPCKTALGIWALPAGGGMRFCPATFAFWVQGLRSGTSPKKSGEFKTKNQTLCELSPGGEYSQRVGGVPIFSEPAPSHRPWTFASGATPVRTKPNYHRVNRKPGKIGTFYFARNRNFLLCLDTPIPPDLAAHCFARAVLPRQLVGTGMTRTGD